MLERLADRVYRYVDTCNVYVLTSGDRALLVDFGTGSVLDHLDAVGVRHVDWVLHTHHHRDQCEGDDRLTGSETRIAVPAREAHLFEDVESFWQRLTPYDVYDCTNEWNSLARSVPVARRLEDYERLTWEDLELLAHPTPGHTKGSLTYLVDIDGVGWAFCGDVIHSAGRLWTLHDLQWDYVELDGLNVGLHSVHVLRERAPDRLAPSHGRVIDPGVPALEALESNMLALHRLLALGYEDYQVTPLPAAVDARIEQVSEHLIAVTHAVANFYVLHVNGHALFFDYGFPSWDHGPGAGFRFVEHSLGNLRERFGIEHVDVVVPTHYHDDHVCGLPFLQDRFGTEVWAYEKFADILERPGRYRLPAYWRQRIQVTRTIAEDETIEWNGLRFTARHNPGHTHYAAAFFGTVDGKRIAVIGDELERDRLGNLRGAGPVYRNRLTADSFVKGIEGILAYEPEVLLTGHNGALRVTRADLEVALEWSRELERRWNALAALPNAVDFALDPDFATIRPYQSVAVPGEPLELWVELRNHSDRRGGGSLRLVPPPGWAVRPSIHEVDLATGEVADVSFEVTPPADASVGVLYVVLVDVTLGEHRFGQASEALVRLEADGYQSDEGQAAESASTITSTSGWS